MDKFVRAGYAAKGLLYGIIGILAVKAAFNAGGKTTDSEGALYTIASQPFGKILVILVAIGLLGYALWRFVQVIFDPSKHIETFGKQITARISYLISGVIYGSLGVEAILIVLNHQSSSESTKNSKLYWTAKLLAQPFGKWLVVTGGIIIIGAGLYRIRKSYQKKFIQMLDLSGMTQKQKMWIVLISQWGIITKGILFLIMGFFLIQAARQYDPTKAIGLDGALQTLIKQPFGQFLLAFVGFGLLAYGIYLGIQALYRQIPKFLD